jgi:hypothetical protein
MQSMQRNTRRLWSVNPQPFLRIAATSLSFTICQLLTALICVTGMQPLAQARHPISVTETHIFVTQQSARARIQLFAEDLLLFHELEPDGEGLVPAAELKRGLELHRDFLTERVTLRDGNGDLIPSQVTDVVPFEIPEDGIPEEDLMLSGDIRT